MFYLETVAADGLVTGSGVKAKVQEGGGGHQQAAHLRGVTLEHSDAFMALQRKRQKLRDHSDVALLKPSKHPAASSTPTTRSKALTVRSPEQVYSSPSWICMAFTASWWPSNSPSVGSSSWPWSEEASGEQAEENVNSEIKSLYFVF